MEKLKNEEVIFLRESNYIEREYSRKAMEDAIVAWRYAKQNDKFDIDYIKAIHKRLMQNLNPRISGHFRDVPIYIAGEIKSQSKEEIEKGVKLLINVWNEFLKSSDESSEDKKNYIKKWHILFEKIHPFEDGNGRTGRILMNIQRIRLNLPILIIKAGFEQQNYYKWFKDEIEKKNE